MAEFLTDPSVLTKDKLKSALLANNILLPNGDHRKGVYVDLYLKNLTKQNQNQNRGLTADSFSSDEELNPGRTADRNRSGRKATKKSDRVREEEVDVMSLTDGDLKEQLLKYNVNVGPIVASTRKLYEKKLQRLLDQGPPETVVMVSQTVQTDSGRNGNDDSDQYSDKEEETEAAELEPEPEPEPVPVVERPLRSRGKTPVTSRTRSNHNKIEKSSSAEQNPKTPERNILMEMFPNDPLSTPTGISATCRRPIKGAAGRPLGDAWLDDLRPRLTEIKRSSSSSYTESRSVPRLSASPPAVPLSATRSPALSSTQPQSRRRPPVWVQLLLVGVVAGFLLFVYQVMESNETSPFSQHDHSPALHHTAQ